MDEGPLTNKIRSEWARFQIDPAGLRHDPIYPKQVELVFSHAPSSCMAHFALGVGTLAYLLTSSSAVTSLLWFFVLVTLCYLRAKYFRKFTARGAEDKDYLQWARGYAVYTFVTALVWSSTAILFFHPDPLFVLVLTFMIGGIAAASIAVFAALPGIGLVFIVSLISPLVIRLFWEGGEFTYMACACLVYLGVMLQSLSRSSASILSALRYQRENVELIDTLKQSNSDIELLNSQLQASSQELRQKNQKLDEALKLATDAARIKGDFLATVSHEVRTPLNGILGMLELFADTDVNESQKEYLEALSTSASSLLELINEILDFSKIESGTIALDPHEFAPQELLVNLRHIFKTRLVEKRIHSEWYIEESVPQMLIGDSHRVQQVLINLIGNAVKFTHVGGNIEVRFSRLDSLGGHTSLLFQVIDSGLGIKKEHQAIIFDSFTQAEDYITRSYGGTGLGLAISRNLVELMGGSIGVNSTLGKGSEFFFSIPFEEPDPSFRKLEENLPQPEPEPETFHGAGAKVLLAEDNRVNQIFAKKLLENWGFEVTVANDGQAAVEAFAGSSFELVLMDCQMPGMGGFEATRIIRNKERAQTLRTPIIALTAQALEGDREACIAAGMDDYLSKPIDVKALKALMIKYLYCDTPPDYSDPQK